MVTSVVVVGFFFHDRAFLRLHVLDDGVFRRGLRRAKSPRFYRRARVCRWQGLNFFRTG